MKVSKYSEAILKLKRMKYADTKAPILINKSNNNIAQWGTYFFINVKFIIILFLQFYTKDC